jgi:hypothetical protein
LTLFLSIAQTVRYLQNYLFLCHETNYELHIYKYDLQEFSPVFWLVFCFS